MVPKVSVILPTHNRKATLPRAIESVLGQSYRDFELIVIDDGSTDGTRQVLESYAPEGRIRIESSPHQGCAATRNMGLDLAVGDYIAFQDSDDEWLPGRLERTVAALDASGPELGVCFSAMHMHLQGGKIHPFPAPRVRKGGLIDEVTLDYQVYGIGIQTATVRRDCFEVAGRFDESLRRFIDLDMFIRLSQHYEFARIEDPLVNWYRGDGISSNTFARYEARRRMIDKYRALLGRRRRHLAHQYVLTGQDLMACDRPRYRRRYCMAFGYACRALGLAPLDPRCRRGAWDILDGGRRELASQLSRRAGLGQGARGELAGTATVEGPRADSR
jgi:glycosyltransferase involved in cell wall biosynthesis